jgi:hypothetical protein
MSTVLDSNRCGFFIASPSELQIRGQTVPRETIKEVVWRDFSQYSNPNHHTRDQRNSRSVGEDRSVFLPHGTNPKPTRAVMY